MHKTNDNSKRFIFNFTISYFILYLNDKMNLFGLSFVLFILKWSAGKCFCIFKHYSFTLWRMPFRVLGDKGNVMKLNEMHSF